MPRVIQCPSCQKKLRIPDERLGTAIKCPGCGKAIKTKPAASPDDEFDDLLPDDAPPLPGRTADSAGKRKARKNSSNFGPFTRKWFIGVGIYVAITIVVSLIGLASETIAMGATVLWIIGMVGFLTAGWIWATADHFRDELWKGLVSLFLSPIGFVLAIRDRTPALRGTIVAGTALIPALLGLGSTYVFKSKYTHEGRQATRAGVANSRLEALERNFDPNSPIEQVTFKLSGNLAKRPNFESEVDALLSEYAMYVPKSAKLDSNAMTLTLECRGDRMTHLSFASYLSNKTGLIVMPPMPGQLTGVAVP